MSKCAGGNRSVGGVMGGMRRGRTIACPVCGKRVGIRPGRAGYLYPHTPAAKPAEVMERVRSWGWPVELTMGIKRIQITHRRRRYVVVRDASGIIRIEGESAVAGRVAVQVDGRLGRMLARLAVNEAGSASWSGQTDGGAP